MNGLSLTTTDHPAPALVASPHATASATIGTLTPGCRIVGLTKGQFSSIDLLTAILAQTGPARVILSTWTPGIEDCERVCGLMDTGSVTSLRLLTDRSFPRRHPKYALRITELFGAEAIRCTRTHAKIVLVRNARWNIAVRTSMNFNKNPRFEQFDLDDSAAICDFFERHVLEVEQMAMPGFDHETWQVDLVFAGLMAAKEKRPVDDLSTASLDDVTLDATQTELLRSLVDSASELDAVTVSTWRRR